MVKFNEHYHCPCNCEHPQQFIAEDGKQYCGKCWVLYKELCVMVLCNPDICN